LISRRRERVRLRGPKPTSWLALCLAASGCRGCGEDKPYTPFGVTSSLPQALPAPSSSAAALASAAEGARPAEKALLAPLNSKLWQLEGSELTAPEGFVFQQALRADFDGDGHVEAVAWLTADPRDAGATPPGELWLFPSAGEAKRLAGLPGFVPTGPNCTLTTALSRTGPRTLTFDTRSDCSGMLIARSPVRALVVIAPLAARPEVLTLRVAAAAPGETLELVSTSDDRDGDGRDDVTLGVAVGVSGGVRFQAPLAWLDRAVGPARDTAEPRATLEKLAASEAARAKNKKFADGVLQNVAGIRRLMGTLCAEGATARLFDNDGAPLACGSLAPVVDSLASAEIGAELARGRVLEAFGALARDGWYFGKTSAAARKRLERSLLDAVEPKAARVTPLAPRPITSPSPRFSPLGFDATSALLLATPQGVVRFQPDGSAPVALDGAMAHSLEVRLDGARFQGVAYACDRSETTLLFDGKSPLFTRLLAPRPGACGRATFEAFPAIAPVAADAAAVSALVGGSLVGEVPGAPPGSPRSPDGRWLIVPTAFGLLVSGPAQRLFNLGTGVERPLALTDCVVANDGLRAACILKGQAVFVQAG
jgi:hypothetical protein